MKARTDQIESPSGISLHLRTWEPDGTPQGAILLVHGLGEHAGRYGHVAEHFAAGGWQVYGPDHQGFGLSGGKRGDATIAGMARDLAALAGRMDAEVGAGTRRVLLGHSMGGLLALVALRDHGAVFPEAVVTGPALNVTRGINPALLGLSRLLGWVHPGMALSNGLNPDDLCTDPAVVKAYREDPQVHDRITARLFNSMVEEGRRLREAPEACPPGARLLLMHGRGDPICFAEDTERYFEGLLLPAKTLKVWPGMKHEILNEPDQAEVLDEIDRFLAKA